MAVTDYYVTTDAMGSVMAVLDEAGNVLERRSYDAFGEATYMLPDGTVVPDSPTGVDIGFQGQLMDELTGMYQMGYRWYSPVLGRWVSRDPIGLKGGSTLITFAENNPLLLADFSGLFAINVEWSGKEIDELPLLRNLVREGTHISINLDVTECPFEVKGTLNGSIGIDFPPLKGASKVISALSGGRLKLNVSAAGGIEADIDYSECASFRSTSVCATLEVFAGVENRMAGVQAPNGQFTKARFGTGATGAALLCWDFCSGEISFDLDYSFALYGEFGNRNLTDKSSVPIGGGSGNLFKIQSGFAPLSKYCNRSPAVSSCCCEKKYGKSKKSTLKAIN